MKNLIHTEFAGDISFHCCTGLALIWRSFTKIMDLIMSTRHKSVSDINCTVNYLLKLRVEKLVIQHFPSTLNCADGPHVVTYNRYSCEYLWFHS